MQHATIKKQLTKVYNTEQQAATITVKYNPWSRYYELSTIEQIWFSRPILSINPFQVNSFATIHCSLIGIVPLKL
jgi:hypothetical protein